MQELLSIKGKKWLLKNADHHSESSYLSTLCTQRGVQIGTYEIDQLASPWSFEGMQAAKERIQAAIVKKERIGIFGDYDCDGITSTLQLTRYFMRNGIEPLVILPHRVHDGYGLQQATVQKFLDANVSLLITVDTGICSIDEVQYAESQGMNVIITDHHHAPSLLPPATAIVHPALSTIATPHPSGAGVVFQLLRALEGPTWDDSKTDSALAAIGTIADLVELKGDNRILVQVGLKALNSLQSGPLAELAMEVRVKDQDLTSTDVAFRIAPRINAAGRMDDAMLAFRALLHGGELLQVIQQLNTERQHQTVILFQDALAELGLVHSQGKEVPPLLSSASAHHPHGIIGLLAGKLTEQFGRPSLVATIHDGTCTASLRSTSAYHITEGLNRCADLLLRFGGHAQAAGCTFVTENLPLLIERLSRDIQERVVAADLYPTLHVDALLESAHISLDLCEQLKQLEPYGQGNPEPRFLLEHVSLASVKLVGKESQHIQGHIGTHKAIGFHLHALKTMSMEPLDIVCRLGMDEWQGRKQPQIFIEDARPSQAHPKQRSQSTAVAQYV